MRLSTEIARNLGLRASCSSVAVRAVWSPTYTRCQRQLFKRGQFAVPTQGQRCPQISPRQNLPEGLEASEKHANSAVFRRLSSGHRGRECDQITCGSTDLLEVT